MGRPINEKVLSAVVATGESDQIDSMGHTVYTLVVIASVVTTGGTVKLQGSPDGTNWVDLASRAVSANGVTEDSVSDKYFPFLRANVTARTDGTYDVYVSASGYAGIR